MRWNLLLATMAIRLTSVGSPPIYTQKERKDETGNSCFSH